jgi:hypothetical protein
MTWGMVAVAGATLVSGAIGSSASKSAANAQAASADRSAQLQKEQFDAQMAAQEPFRQGGLRSMNELQRQLGIDGDASSAGYGNLMRNFGQQDFQADPGYQFRLSEGLKGLDRQAAARGGLISGSALKAAQGYGQEQASQEYQNAFNRYQANRGSVYGMLSGQQGVGQTATNAQGQAGQNYANQAGQAYQNAGAARASGYMGSANAIGGALNQGANLYTQNNMFNRMFPTSTASPVMDWGYGE